MGSNNINNYMNDLYTLLSNKNCLKSTKFYENIELKCSYCGKLFLKHKRDFLKSVRLKRNYITCSEKCRSKMQNTSIEVKCEQCGKSIIRRPSSINERNISFCSASCATTYHNTHKTFGYRRSKLETWIEEQLTNLYPNLEIHFNRKDAINSELDIYIPSLRLAFELNGIFHYEPIYSQEQFDKIQNNDQRKFHACSEQKISLCIIDTSKQKGFKEYTSTEYLNIITNIINDNLELVTGNSPANPLYKGGA